MSIPAPPPPHTHTHTHTHAYTHTHTHTHTHKQTNKQTDKQKQTNNQRYKQIQTTSQRRRKQTTKDLNKPGVWPGTACSATFLELCRSLKINQGKNCNYGHSEGDFFLSQYKPNSATEKALKQKTRLSKDEADPDCVRS